MSHFFDGLPLGKLVVHTGYSLPCEKDTSAFYTFDYCCISVSEDFVGFQEVVDDLSLDALKLCMLSPPRPVLFNG